MVTFNLTTHKVPYKLVSAVLETIKAAFPDNWALDGEKSMCTPNSKGQYWVTFGDPVLASNFRTALVAIDRIVTARGAPSRRATPAARRREQRHASTAATMARALAEDFGVTDAVNLLRHRWRPGGAAR